MSLDSNIFNPEAETLVFTSIEKEPTENTSFTKVDFNNLLSELVSELHKRNIQSAIIEGGRMTLQAFIDAELWDEARVFTGASYFEEGTLAPELNEKPAATHSVGNDKLELYKR